MAIQGAHGEAKHLLCMWLSCNGGNLSQGADNASGLILHELGCTRLLSVTRTIRKKREKKEQKKYCLLACTFVVVVRCDAMSCPCCIRSFRIGLICIFVFL